MQLKRLELDYPLNLASIDLGRNDAKFDHLDRYFLDTGVVDRIYSRDKSIVIGRKGTGKTAIAYYIDRQCAADYSRFSSILSFKDIPVALLEQFEDTEHKLSNRFVLLWRYIFLIEIAKLLLQDNSVTSSELEPLKTFIDLNFPTLKRSPREYLKATIESKFKVNFQVVGAERTRKIEESVVNLLSFVENLEEVLLRVVPLANTFLVFADELDDIYEDTPDYYNIVTAMFKAGMDLNARFRQAHKKVNIVMLLRSDIYENIKYSDKNKWSDMTEHLSWMPRPNTKYYEIQLFRLINLRLGASLKHEVRADEDYWRVVFASKPVVGRVQAFNYILTRTFFRPRDIIQFTKQALATAVHEGTKTVTPAMIRKCEYDYSIWFRDELADELRTRVPTIDAVFDALKRHRSASFLAQDINSYLQRSGVVSSRWTTTEILRQLYNFSVIGMFETRTSTSPIFKYKSPRLEFRPKTRLSIHYGLRPALEMVRHR